MADDLLRQQMATEGRKWRASVGYFALRLFGFHPDPAQEQLFDYWDDPANQRIGMQACKGPGKTAGLAILNWHFLVTRDSPRMAATSISKDNLQDNFWTEMAKWMALSPFLQAKFTWTKTRIFCKDHPSTWWLSARTWSRSADATQQNLTMAGLHAKHTLATIDESGGVPDGVVTTAEGTLATIGGEHRLLQAGNPTHVEGPLYRAATTDRHLWKMIEITGDPEDPRRSPRVSVTWAKEQIDKYGKDNPWVLVNVFGKFPPGSINTLLSPDQIAKAMKLHYQETVYNTSARVIGVDPGRFGGARSVIFPRQGMVAFRPVVLRPNRNERNWTGVFAARIGQAINKFKADATFVDDTGGWGAGIIDALWAAGHVVFPINFGGSALDGGRYKNRRAEMHFKTAKWIEDGGALPYMPELQREGTATKYWYSKGKFEIEEKEQVQIALGESPDLWDALVLTHAQDVVPATGIEWIDKRTLRTHTDRDAEEPDMDRLRQMAVVMEEDD